MFPPSWCRRSKDEGGIFALLALDERRSSVSPGCLSLHCAVRRRTWTWRWIPRPPSGVMLSILARRTWGKGNPTWSLGFSGRSLRSACLPTLSSAEMKVNETISDYFWNVNTPLLALSPPAPSLPLLSPPLCWKWGTRLRAPGGTHQAECFSSLSIFIAVKQAPAGEVVPPGEVCQPWRTGWTPV